MNCRFMYFMTCVAAIDVMHALPLNLIKTELHRILAPLKDNTKVNPADRDPRVGGVLALSELALTLERVMWTNELKRGAFLVLLLLQIL